MTSVNACLLLLFFKVLAFFRFFVLLLAYAVVRLRHWWVIAVRRSFLCFPVFSFLSPPGVPGDLRSVNLLFQVTTLVSSAFLIVKVILSEVGFLGLAGESLCDYLTLLLCKFPVVSSFFSTQLLTKGAFGYLLPIVSFVIAWLETWFLDFKVLTQEAEEERCKYFAPLWEELAE